MCNFFVKTYNKKSICFSIKTEVEKLNKTLIVVFILNFVCCYCYSQSCNECEISGIVKDSSDEAVTYANIQLIRLRDSLQEFDFTNDSGYFSFKDLSYGRYKVIVNHISFAKYTSNSIVINNTEEDIFKTIHLSYQSVRLKPI